MSRGEIRVPEPLLHLDDLDLVAQGTDGGWWRVHVQQRGLPFAHKPFQRLMRTMGLPAVDPKLRTRAAATDR